MATRWITKKGKILTLIIGIFLFSMIFAPVISTSAGYNINNIQSSSRLDLGSDITKMFENWTDTLVGGLIKLFMKGLGAIGGVFIWAIKQAVGGILGFVGVPFTAWSKYVANNGGWFIPIIFVAILGIAFLVGYSISVVYGFEKDITGAEGTIHAEEEHIAEEEEE